MIVIGLDPGVERTGFGVLERDGDSLHVFDSGCIKTRKENPLSERLWVLENDLKMILKKWRPQAAAIEKIYFSRNVKTALSVSHARGVVLETLYDFGIPTFEYNPQAIKIAVTGVGNADKLQMKKMVEALLSLSSPISSDDAADALACGLCFFATEKLQSHVS